MGCRPPILDKLVKAARDEVVEPGGWPFSDVEPYPTPVIPASLLTEVASTIRRIIVMELEQADAAALWTASTWFMNAVNIAPLAIINAPEKSCGKSQLLDVMGRMSARPLPVSNVSTASLFRSIELWSPTLLIDEADTFIRANDDLKGLINAGHSRTSAFVLRVVGDNHEPKMFTVWGAKALAGISLEKHLPDSTMSRAIVFNLRRKLPHEKVERLRHTEPGLFEEIASKLARFAEDYSQQVLQARPDLPDELSDRAQDNWEPLLAIAECAGPDWLKRAKVAALKISAAAEDAVSTGNELLADIQFVFESKQVGKLKTTDLIDALVSDEEKPWATYNRGKPFTPRQLANLLAPYGIKPKTVRFGAFTPKGYEAAQFTDAFSRYLATPGDLPKRCNESPDGIAGQVGCVADASGVATTPTIEETLVPVPELDCGGVVDSSGDAERTSTPDVLPSDNFGDY